MFEIKVHLVHEYADPAIGAILHKLEAIMATLDDLVTKVTALSDVEDGVIALLNDIKTRLDAAGQDPAKLQALSDAIDAQSAKLAAAVAANTPAA